MNKKGTSVLKTLHCIHQKNDYSLPITATLEDKTRLSSPLVQNYLVH